MKLTNWFASLLLVTSLTMLSSAAQEISVAKGNCKPSMWIAAPNCQMAINVSGQFCADVHQ
jgi:hypothetical protein